MTTRVGGASVVRLLEGDLDAIEALRAENNDTLGFLAEPVMADYVGRGGALGISADDRVIAYCLFARHRHHIRIIHLCVGPTERGSGHARALVDAVVKEAEAQRVGGIKLNCRRDFPANAVWPRLGFIAVDEKKAKTPGALLTTWFRGSSASAAQGDMFTAVVSDDRVHAVIDAQLVYQLERGDDEVASGLRADFLNDLLALHVTAETFDEINRAGAEERRRQSRNFAHTFPRVQHDANRMATAEKDLQQILPSARKSQRSDIRQVAMTSASDVSVFLTRDERLLGKAAEINRVASVEVMHPNRMIVRLAEFTESESYTPSPVSGLDLAWSRVREGDVASLAIETLLGPHERKGVLKARLDGVLSNPQIWRTEGLWSGTVLMAVRSIKKRDQQCRLVVGVCRARRGERRAFFNEYAIASVVHEAVRLDHPTVQLERDSITPEAADVARRLGFTPMDGHFVRDCPTKAMSLSELRAAVHSHQEAISPMELERACSPVALEDSACPCLIVPIKPGYAKSLFDTKLAAADLFGAEKSALLRFENVYFRKSTRRHMIRAPARILWYVSEGVGVVAVSWLDDVQIGTPKDMFRDHRRLGALSWSDIYEMCRGDEVQDIMVLKFSHTYLFRSPVDWRSLQRVYAKRDSSPVVQSPSIVPREVFLDIYRMGFGSGELV